MPSCTEAKAVLRAELRRRAAAMDPARRRESERALLARFLALPAAAEAGALLLFAGVGTEPDTRPLLEDLWRRGRGVLLPKCLPGRAMEARRVRGWEELEPGAFGIPEPSDACPAVDKGDIDLILVPALCYDLSRRRLGQGGGYYDRYLAGYTGRTVGLCREGLLQRAVPAEEHDRAVDLVVTEERLLGSLSES